MPHTFALTVVPNGIESDTGNLKISVCVDLRPYNDIDRSRNPNEPVSEWSERIQGFHAETRTSGGYRRLVNALKATGAFSIGTQRLTVVKVETPEPDDDATSLWRKYLQGEQATQRVQSAVDSPIRPRRVLTRARDASGAAAGDVSALTGPALLLGQLRQQSVLASVPTLTLNQRRGIERAVHDRTAAIRARLETVGISSANVRTEARAHIQHTISALSTIATRFAATPEYVIQAYDLLNGSPNLRRFFGTTIDAVLSLPSRNESLLRLVKGRVFNGNFTLTLLLTGTTSDVFRTTPANMSIVSFGAQDVLMGRGDDRYGAYVDRSVLRLKARTRTISFDPQSVAKAADEVAEALARLPDQQQTTLPEWRLSQSATAIRDARVRDERQLRSAELQSALRTLDEDHVRVRTALRINNQIADTSTRGHGVYLTTPDRYDESDTSSSEYALVRGYVVYARRKDGDRTSAWMSLTTIGEEYQWRGRRARGFHDFDQPNELGIHVGGGVQIKEENAPQTELLEDGFLFCWDGTGLSTRSPLRHYEHDGAVTADHELARELVDLAERADMTAPEVTALQLRAMNVFGIDWFPFIEQPHNPPELMIRRSHGLPNEANPVKLQFGNQTKYEYLVVSQYHNGYVPIRARLLNEDARFSDIIDECRTEAASFLRHDHIREVIVSLEQNIYTDPQRKELSSRHPGESPTDLVVRTGELLFDDDCARFLLPPPIPTFQTYLWYSREDLAGMTAEGRTITERELAGLYFRYACDARTEAEFQGNITRNNRRRELLKLPPQAAKGCQSRCDRFCGGTAQPPVYPHELRYLPDPVVTGLVIRFFVDKECRIPAPDQFPKQFCAFRQGQYPALRPWKVVLRKLDPGRATERIDRDEASQTITISLYPGGQFYAQVIPTFNAARTHFAPSLIDPKSFPPDTVESEGLSPDHTASLMYANPTLISFTHAVQRPLFDPVMRSISIKRFNPDKKDDDKPQRAPTFHAEVALHCEQLNVQFGVSLPGTSPTGELELFALWNDYDDRNSKPSKGIGQKRDRSSAAKGFVRVAHLRCDPTQSGDVQPVAVSESTANPHTNYWVPLTFCSDPSLFSNTHFTDLVFKVRNRSKFYSYFHNGSASDPRNEDDDAELHSRWSAEYSLSANPPRVLSEASTHVVASFMPSNAKPEPPHVQRIVALTIRDTDERWTSVRFRSNRVRIYFDRDGRQKSGHEERIGILVSDEANAYQKYLTEFVSKAGRDAVTDNVDPVAAPSLAHSLLTAHEFELDEANLEREYSTLFRPRYDRAEFGRPGALGIVSYIPQYDSQQGLWYIDPEFLIRNQHGHELHNPFVRLGLVHYQPFSANYNHSNADSADGYAADYRVSAPVSADFFGVYPSRAATNPVVLFGSPSLERFTLSGAVSSLFFRSNKQGKRLRSQFVLSVERMLDGQTWTRVQSWIPTHEVAVDGRVVARDAEATCGSGTTRQSHMLLPDRLEELTRGEEFTRGRFECALNLNFNSGFFESRTGGRYRAIVQEVEWFDGSSDRSWHDIADALSSFHIGQIPGIRIKQSLIFDPARC